MGDQRHLGHLGDLDRQRQPDDLRHLGHLDDLDHQRQPDDQRQLVEERLGDPCPVMKRMGYYPGVLQGAECPCPARMRMGCYLGVEFPR